jgi:hypothetical protein
MTNYSVASIISELTQFAAAHGVGALPVGAVIVVGDELGRGGFGVVQRCRLSGVAGAGCGDLIIKTYTVAQADRNIQVIAGLHRALGSLNDASWVDHLLGVPFWCGTVRDGNGQEMEASLALDLSTRGFASLDDVIEDDALRRDLLTLSIDDRAELARDLAMSFAVLESVAFIHADVNCENAFVHLRDRRATLIDFDSGVVRVTGKEVPLTRGKPGIFVAPELIGPSGTICENRMSAGSERWAAAAAIGHVLFATSPLFFLRNTGIATLRDYADKFQWPDINVNDPLFFAANAPAYLALRDELDDGPAGIVAAFAAAYGPGIDDPTARPSGAEWVDALVGGPPVFDFVGVDCQAVTKGGTVLLTWSARAAREVYADGDGPYPACHQVPVTLHATRRVRLVAVNQSDQSAAESDEITVLCPLDPPEFLDAARVSPSTRRGMSAMPTVVLSGTPHFVGVPTLRPPVLPSFPRLVPKS